MDQIKSADADAYAMVEEKENDCQALALQLHCSSHAMLVRLPVGLVVADFDSLEPALVHVNLPNPLHCAAGRPTSAPHNPH